MTDRSSKNSCARDTKLLTKSIVDAAAGDEAEQQPEDTGKNPAAVALGRLGGMKGGKARAATLSPERRREIAKKAAAARWGQT